MKDQCGISPYKETQRGSERCSSAATNEDGQPGIGCACPLPPPDTSCR